MVANTWPALDTEAHPLLETPSLSFRAVKVGYDLSEERTLRMGGS
jgi:hypothetical protein